MMFGVRIHWAMAWIASSFGRGSGSGKDAEPLAAFQDLMIGG
jgi:hypothetical protein